MNSDDFNLQLRFNILLLSHQLKLEIKMSLLKRLSLIVLFFLMITIIISLFLPSSFFLERKIIVNADQEQVFKQVNELSNWKNWSPWTVKDPSVYGLKQNFSGPLSGEGASFRWKSEVEGVGAGEIEITAAVKNDSITSTLDFGRGDVVAVWRFEEVASGVEVTWSLTADFGFNPFRKFLGLFMEGQITPDFELGLNRLKAFSEELPKIHRVEVKEKSLDSNLWFLSIRDTVQQMEMNNVHGKSFTAIRQYMNEFELESNAPLMVIYHFWSKDKIDIEVGLPVNDSTIMGNSRIKLNKIAKTNVVFATHHGAYERLPETYFGINEYMRKNEVVVTGPPWESYVTDPSSEPNPANWETIIYFPIK
jgi:effector-binding domain-containing protein